MIAHPVDALPSGLDAIERCYEDGRYLTAYLAARQGGLLAVDRASAPDHALLIGRIYRVVGAPRRGRKLVLDAWRRHRRHPRAAIHAVHELASAGPLAALDAMDRIGELAGASDENRADWACARALWLSGLRDFLAADRAWAEARALHDGAWTWCVRAILDDERDRPDAALAAIERARATRPWYRPAIEIAARALVRARRADDARALLADASVHLEAASIDLHLAIRHREAGDLDAAVASLLRAVARSPAMERDLHDGLAHLLGDVHYRRGDVDLAVRLMRLVDDDDVRARADRIAATPGVRRVLPVPHVPQYHHTCAPATLTAIAERWGEPVDQLELAEEICHDGTPAGNERRWAEARGFVARQLTVTWDAARALIDAGVPIALTTVFTLGGHLQPVAGYDERRGTLLVAEPGAGGVVELDWDALAAAQAPFGPRGLVFVPAARAALLDGLDLPDAALYDHHHALEMALQRHDRAAAQAAFDALAAAAPPDHYLRHQARRALACYDGDERGTLEWVTALRAAHPDHAWLRLCELTSLHGHASEDRRAELVRGLLADHGDDAAILVACARFLVSVGDRADALAAARRAIGAAPHHAPAYRCTADLLWDESERVRATRLHRFASCLAEGDEDAAWTYFLTATITGEVDDALAHLRDRVDRLQARSGGPAQTLCEAYGAVGREAEGLAILEAAIAAHPDDGELLLVAAEQHRLAGDLAHAASRLDAARDKVPDPAWRRVAAALAAHRGDVSEAIALRRQLVDDDPLDVASQRAYVRLLERAGDAAAARAHVEAACARFPYHLPLAELCDQVLSAVDRDAARRHLEALVARRPRSAWALRRLADVHAEGGDLVRARELLARARACADDPAWIDHAEAMLCAREGHRGRAMAYLQAAIQVDVDEPGAIDAMLDLAGDGAEAARILDGIAGELTRQGSAGGGALAYAAGLRRWLDPQTALERVRAMRRERGYQWSAWSAEIDALLDVGRRDEAAALAREAARRFGHEPRAWQQLAAVEATRGDRAAAIAALEVAATRWPHAIHLVRELSDAHLAAGDPAAARAVLDRALAHDPLDPSTHGYLAQLAREEGEPARAVEHLRRAVELDPSYGWAWDRLLDWSDDPREVLPVARAALARTPTAIPPRLVLANRDTDLRLDARLALLDEALTLDPARTGVTDAKAVLLAEHERWDDALAACRPAFWGEAPPPQLRGRAAWIRYQRGERDAAIADMLAVIRQTPGFEWGIHRLLHWAEQTDRPVAVAEQLVAAAPRSAAAHATLGEIRRLAGDAAGAEASFRHALAIDAADRLARLGLFDVLYEREDHAAAAPLLDGLDDDDPFVLSRRIQASAAAGRRDDADATLTRMLVDLEIEHDVAVGEAFTGYVRAGLRPHAERLLAALLARPDAPRAVGRAWWAHVGRDATFTRWRTIRHLPRSEAAAHCAIRHVETLVGSEWSVRMLWFLATNYQRARAWVELWGAVGYALAEDGHYWLTRWWMSDHDRQRGAAGWMLSHLARALLASGRIAEAIQVCRRALALPADGLTARTRLMLGPLVALDDAEASRRELDAARGAEWSADDRFLAGLTEALIVYRTGPDDDDVRRGALTRAARALWSRPGTRPSYVCRRIYDHVVDRVCRALGPAGKAWRAELQRIAFGI